MSKTYEVRLKPGVTVVDHRGRARAGKLRGQVAKYDLDEEALWFLFPGQAGAIGQPHGPKIPFADILGVYTNSDDAPGVFEGENLINAWKRWAAKNS